MDTNKELDFQLILDNMKDAICQTDTEGFIRYISPSCRTVLGYGQDSLVGQRVFDFIHPDDLPIMSMLFQKGIEEKSGRSVGYRFQHARGHYIWLETTGNVILDDQGAVVGAVFSSRDVTDRKFSEERQSNFFALSTDMMGIASTEGYFVTINNAWEKILGWSAEELLNKPYLSLVHPDDHEATIKIAGNLKNGEKVYAFENRYLCKDGSYRWISWNSSPDNERKLIFFVARDVTKQIGDTVELKKRVAISEELLSSIVDNLSGAVYRCKNDENWTMEYLSQGCYELTGYDPEEIINNSKISFGNLVLDKYRSYLLALVNDRYEHQYEIRAKNGQLRWVLDRGKTIFSDEGKAIGQEGVLTDITALKLLEQESCRLKEQLQLVTDNISEVVWLRSPDNSRVIFVNTAFEEMWGLACDELHKNPNVFIETVHEDDKNLVLESFQQHLKGHNFDLNYRIVRPDGEARWVHARSKRVKNSSGETIANVGSAVDITELKQFEIAIAESESFLKKSQKVGGVGSYIVDIIGDNCRSSPVLNDILGLEQNEIHPMAVWPMIIHPDDRERVLTAHQDSIDGINNYKQEYRIIRPSDGAVRWVIDTGEFEVDMTGRPYRIVGTIIDITNRKQLETMIYESKKMYQSVVDTQKEMIARYLPDTTLTFVNDAYCRTFGKKRSELLGNKYLMFLSAESHDDELASLKRLSPVHPSDTREYEVMLPDGSLGYQQWVEVGIFDEAGELVEIQGSAIDITERKKAEEEAQQKAHQSATLLTIASRLNAELDSVRVKQIICQEVINALSMRMSIYLSYDQNTRIYHMKAAAGLSENSWLELERLNWDGIDNILNKQGKSGVTLDLSTVPELPFAQTLLSYGINSCIYCPVEREDASLGVLLIYDDKKVDLSEDDISLLKGISNLAASAITNARLYGEAKKRLTQIQALHNIDLAITGSHDLRVTFQVILDEVTKMLGTDAAAILRLNPNTGTLNYEHWHGFRSRNVEGISIPIGEGYIGAIVLNRKTVHIHDLRERENDLKHNSLLAEEGFVAYYAVPLIAKGTVLGVLEVFHRKRIASSEEWLSFLETLAGQAAIAIDNAVLFSKLERSNANLLRAYDATIEGWAYALDLKDEETEHHSQRVTELTMRIAKKVGIEAEHLVHVRRGSLLHDIGKMGIPDSILLKPGKLTDEEWVIMRKHPVYAFEMLSPISYLYPAMDIPYCHHEKWDGSGYPRGIKGEQIPLAARIFAIVDVYDALSSDRPYREAWSKEKTLNYILELSGIHFDPRVVEVFITDSAIIYYTAA